MKVRRDETPDDLIDPSTGVVLYLKKVGIDGSHIVFICQVREDVNRLCFAIKQVSIGGCFIYQHIVPRCIRGMQMKKRGSDREYRQKSDDVKQFLKHDIPLVNSNQLPVTSYQFYLFLKNRNVIGSVSKTTNTQQVIQKKAENMFCE